MRRTTLMLLSTFCFCLIVLGATMITRGLSGRSVGKIGGRRPTLLLRQPFRRLRRSPHNILVALQTRPGNPQLMHLVDQRSALQAKFGGCSLRAANHPTDAFERAQD